MRTITKHQYCLRGASLSTEEAVVHMNLWQPIISLVNAVVCHTTGATYAMWTPITKREVGEVMFLDLLLGRQLRIQHFSKSSYA